MWNKNNLLLFMVTLVGFMVLGQNPIAPNKGLNDPHIHIFKDTAYVYASHDKSIKNTDFVMEDWWVWSSPDLVNWTYRNTLKPKDTYIGKSFASCWATDIGFRNGKYYWYFSEGNKQTGVVVGNTPVGPWSDPLGAPLLNENLTITHEYDMAIFEEDGEHYIIFGVWDYYIAKLNYDMISLAETPRKLEISDSRGPYNQDGKNKEKPTDDKPFVHKYKGKYYLSWGCFYAMSENLYGPYEYKDTIIKQESFAKGYDAPTWPNGFLQGRHGSFFEWHNQWYYAYCDISQTGNRWFRDTFISYIHYKANGEIATIRVDGTGVGNYLASSPKIEAEDYFKAEGFVKKQRGLKGFSVRTNAQKSYLNFPNIKGTAEFSGIMFRINSSKSKTFSFEIRRNGLDGEVLASKEFDVSEGNNGFTSLSIPIGNLKEIENLYFLISQKNGMTLEIDNFKFYK